MMICMDCGNHKEFSRDVYGEASFTEKEIFYEGDENSPDDWDSYDEGDREIIERSEVIECDKCGSENVKYGLTEREVIEIRIKHTDNIFRKWYKDELPEKAQDKTILAEAIAEKV